MRKLAVILRSKVFAVHKVKQVVCASKRLGGSWSRTERIDVQSELSSAILPVSRIRNVVDGKWCCVASFLMLIVARRVDLKKVAFGQGSSLAFSLVGASIWQHLAATDINRGNFDNSSALDSKDSRIEKVENRIGKISKCRGSIRSHLGICLELEERGQDVGRTLHVAQFERGDGFGVSEDSFLEDQC